MSWDIPRKIGKIFVISERLFETGNHWNQQKWKEGRTKTLFGLGLGLGYLRVGLCLPKGPATTGIGRNERRGRTTTLFGLGLGCLRLGSCSLTKGTGNNWNRQKWKEGSNNKPMWPRPRLLKTWIVLTKGTGNNWNQQKWKEGSNENKSLSDKPDIGTRLNTFKRRAKKAKVILRSTLFDLFQVRFRSQKDQDSKSVSNLYRCIDFGLIGFHILGNC